MTYIDNLQQRGYKIPECYVSFRADPDLEEYNGMICPKLDREVYNETTEVHFDWDDHMLEQFVDDSVKEFVPIGILHDTEFLDDAYIAINTEEADCGVYLCELDEETDEIAYDKLSDTLEQFLESLNYAEDTYIEYLENKFNTTLPKRYKDFIQSYEYINYDGELKFNETNVLFSEFPNLQWAAEFFNKSDLEWLPLASLGEDHNEYNDVIAIKVGEENCPVFFLNGDERELVSNSLNEFLV